MPLVIEAIECSRLNEEKNWKCLTLCPLQSGGRYIGVVYIMILSFIVSIALGYISEDWQSRGSPSKLPRQER